MEKELARLAALQNDTVVIQPVKGSIVDSMKRTNVTMNMFDFFSIIFYVILASCLCTIIVAFRREIKIVVKRVLYLLGLLPYWKKFYRWFMGIDEVEEAAFKVNYEIYNPSTGTVVDRQFEKFPEDIKRELELEQRKKKMVRTATPKQKVEEDILKDCSFFNDTEQSNDEVKIVPYNGPEEEEEYYDEENPEKCDDEMNFDSSRRLVINEDHQVDIGFGSQQGGDSDVASEILREKMRRVEAKEEINLSSSSSMNISIEAAKKQRHNATVVPRSEQLKMDKDEIIEMPSPEAKPK